VQLRRELRLPTVVSTSAGLAFAAVNFLAVVQVAAYTGGESVWIALTTAGILCLGVALLFSELAARHPTAAGIRVWLRQGIGDGFSLTFTLVYFASILLVIAADAFVLGAVVHAGLPAVPGVAWVVVALVGSLAANLMGVRWAGRLQDLTAYALLAALVILSVLSLALHGLHPARLWPPAHGASGVLQGIAEGVFVFVGFEWVTPLAEEVRSPTSLPPGMLLAVGALTVAFGIFGVSLTALAPASSLAHTLTPQLLVGRAALGAVGFWAMLAITAVTAVTTFNGAFVSGSRLLYALAREHVLHPTFAHLSRRLVPDRALMAMGGVALALALGVSLTGRYVFLINLGAAIESAMYTVAAVALLGMRRRQPHARPFFRAPGGWALPALVMAVFGILGVVSLFLPADLPGPHVPWTLVCVAVLTLLAGYHTYRVAPVLRRQAQMRRAARTAAGQGPLASP
jgi:amino acid transporter